MKKILLICLFINSITTYAGVTYEKFIRAVIMQESTFKKNSRGDNGKARGYFQIHRSYLADANWWAGTRYTHWDMHNPAKAFETVENYFERYATLYKREKRRPVTYKVLAMLHNQGPRGYKSRAGQTYWVAIQRTYRRMYGEHLSKWAVCKKFDKIYRRKSRRG